MPLLWIVHIDAMAGCSSPYETGATSDGVVTDVYGTPNYSEGALLCINDLSKYIKQHIRDYPDFREVHMGYIHKCWPNDSSYYWMATDSQCSEAEKRESRLKKDQTKNSTLSDDEDSAPKSRKSGKLKRPNATCQVDPRSIGQEREYWDITCPNGEKVRFGEGSVSIIYGSKASCEEDMNNEKAWPVINGICH